jgi:hypothetical protein
MSEISHFKVFILCKIDYMAWYSGDLAIVDDEAVDNSSSQFTCRMLPQEPLRKPPHEAPAPPPAPGAPRCRHALALPPARGAPTPMA